MATNANGESTKGKKKVSAKKNFKTYKCAIKNI